MVGHMATNQLFTDNQHGFLNGRSCTTNLLAVLDAWSEALEIGVAVDAVYLDFSKAFNIVPHHRLLMKLDTYGMRGKISRVDQAVSPRKKAVCECK